MRTKRKYSIITSAHLVLALIFISCTNSQKLGDKAYADFAYSKAINHYLKVSDKDYDTYVKLADSYVHLNQYEEAETWYRKALETDKMKERDYLSFAKTLHANGKYGEAEIYYYEYYKFNPDDRRVINRLKYVDSAKTPKPEDLGVVRLANINSDYASDFSPVIHGDKLVFSSERNWSGKNKTIEWTDRPFSEIYVAHIDEDGSLSEVDVFDKDVQSKFGDGSLVFTPDGNTVFFTRQNVEGKKAIASDDNVVHLQIFRSTKEDKGWSDPELLNFNSSEYSCMHPALSSNGKWLYFASDKENPNVNADLYVAYINPESNEILRPIRFGSNINTEGNEVFPVINTINGTDYLYFSSDGHAGPGGLDILRVKRQNALYQSPELLENPINSTKDDLSLVLREDGKSGYLSSNRGNKLGIDNLYRYAPSFPSFVRVHLQNPNGTPLKKVEGVTVTIEAQENSSTETLVMNKNGTYLTKVNPSGNYTVYAKGKPYIPAEENIDQAWLEQEDTAEVYLTLRGIEAQKMNELTIEKIFYDYDKADLTTDAREKLDKIVAFLNDNPNINIWMAAHADARGTDDYNMDLSKKRIQSVIRFFEKHGVLEDRYTAEYHGEKHIENSCINGKECSDALHRENRRTEFIVKTTDENKERMEQASVRFLDY